MSSHPTVEVLYCYESTNDRGHSVIVQPGEKYALLCDRDEDWWYVGKDVNSEDGFYIPRTYVKRGKNRITSVDGASSLETFRRPVANRQSAIITSNLYSLAANNSNADDPTASSLRRRNNYNPGFKLADPNRISRSIPVDLNFVHHIPNFTNGFNNTSTTNENAVEYAVPTENFVVEVGGKVSSTKNVKENQRVSNGNVNRMILSLNFTYNKISPQNFYY